MSTSIMRNIYQCKVCLETFTLLRYLRKHVTIPTVEGHQLNKCQSYYSGTGTLQENLKVNHKIVPENRPKKELNGKPKRQQVQLISTNKQDEVGDPKDDDDCRIIEYEPACLKFEPDEEDELYFFDRENPILPNNDIANNSPQRLVNTENKTKKDNSDTNFLEDKEQDELPRKETIVKRHTIRTRATGIANISPTRFVNNADKTKQDNSENGFFDDEKQVKTSIKRVFVKRPKSHAPEIGTDVLPANTTEINSSAETTICKTCKMACTSLENLCIHYETLHKLPVVVLARVIANHKNPKCKRTEAGNVEEAIGQTKTHKCSICRRTFTTLNSLKRHKSSIHDREIFNCNVCQKTFHRLDSLKQHHLSDHDGFRYECNLCAKKFRYSSHLIRHKSSIHDNVRFTCDICQKAFNQLENLKQHKLRVHEYIRYKCNNCSKHFSSTQSLRLHKASIHEGVRYKCELCEEQFRRERCLKDHKASAHDGVRYQCNTCPKQYSHKQNLVRHKAVRHKTQRFRANSA